MCSGVRGRGGGGRNPLNPLKWAVGVGFVHETCEVYQSNSDTHSRSYTPPHPTPPSYARFPT